MAEELANLQAPTLTPIRTPTLTLTLTLNPTPTLTLTLKLSLTLTLTLALTLTLTLTQDYEMPWHSVELAAPPPGALAASAE